MGEKNIKLSSGTLYVSEGNRLTPLGEISEGSIENLDETYDEMPIIRATPGEFSGTIRLTRKQRRVLKELMRQARWSKRSIRRRERWFKFRLWVGKVMRLRSPSIQIDEWLSSN